ncbi:MAG: carboxymuconolactone decarboxylase family protein [Candidatus Marinimicrobia bacterium]|nr:carboxymuconolactone decarboxylase family protein [Candidatus Neomarinimicrobiota bacterium]
MNSYKDIAKDVFSFVGTLSKENPGIAQGYMTLHKTVTSEGALSVKEKELIAIGISINAHCEGCLSVHVGAALEAGASREEIVETIGVAVMMGGGPAIAYGKRAYDAMMEFSK